MRGAIAWSKGDWMTVLLAYLEAITWEPALQDLWPRVQVAATRLEGERECEKNDIERLKGLINRVAVTELTDDGMAVLGTVVSVLPVDGEMEPQRDAIPLRLKANYRSARHDVRSSRGA